MVVEVGPAFESVNYYIMWWPKEGHYRVLNLTAV
jgi:hypothetical protein